MQSSCGNYSSDEDEEPEPAEEDEEEVSKEGSVELENWIDYIKQTVGIAENCLPRARLEDWAAGQRRRKWRWAGHAARRLDGQWSNKVLFCNEFPRHRRVGVILLSPSLKNTLT